MDLDIKRSFTWLTFGSAVTHPLWLWFTIVLLVGTLGEAEFGVINAPLAFMMIAAGITRMVLALGFAVAAGFNVMANLALIPSFGPAGAAATTVMTQLLVAACLLLRYKYRTRT